MKSLMKITVFLIAFAMCACSLSFALAQEEDVPRQVINTGEYLTLKGLGVTDSSIDALYEDSTLTRAQYAYMLAGLMGYTNQSSSSDEFIDLKDSMYKGAVYFLKDRGIVSGVNSYQFKPDDNITYETALIMSVRAMEYGELAQLKYGAGTDGLVMMAASLDITDGVKNTGTEPLSVADACVILKNTATEPMLVQESYGDDWQFNSRDHTILSKYRDTYVSYGIMTDNGITALENGSAVNEGRVVIDGKTLLNKSFDGAKELVGMNVEFYYTDDNNLVYALPYDNEVVVIEAESIDTTGVSVNSVSYFDENGKRKTAQIDINSTMIYNGYAHPYFTADDLKITGGQLIMISNDGDSDYDVVCVREYKDYIVSGVSDGVLVAGNISIDPDDYIAAYFYNAEGSAIAPESISAGAVATVYESFDKKVIEIYLCSEKISGTVNETGENKSGEEYYLINETEYTASADYKKGLENGLLNAAEIEVGGSYMLSLNIFGKIVKAESIYPGQWRTAYCTGIKTDSSSLDSRVRANLVMSDGTHFQPFFASKVSLNGGLRDKSEKLLDSGFFADESGVALRQPVRIKLDAKGNITDIEVPRDRTDTPYGFDTSVFSYDKYVPSGLYRGSTKRAIDNCILTNETVIFEDPYYGKAGSEYVNDEVKAYTTVTFPAEASLANVRFYDLDEGMRAGIMVYATRDITPANDFFFVENITNTIDKYGEEKKRISGYSAGTYKVYLELEPGVIPASIKRGDVCKYSVEGNYIASISKIISLGAATKPYADTNVVNAKWANIYGYLYTKTDNSVVVVSPASYKDAPLIGTSLGNGPKVTIYDLKLDRIYPGTMADVYTDFVPDSQGNYTLSENSTMIYIQRQYDYAKEIVVVKR